MAQLPFEVSEELQTQINNLEFAPIGKAEDLTGRQFNRLTVLGRVPGKGKVRWYTICSCEKHTIGTARGDLLKD